MFHNELIRNELRLTLHEELSNEDMFSIYWSFSLDYNNFSQYWEQIQIIPLMVHGVEEKCCICGS